MRIFKGMMSKKAGLSPGTLVHVGERKLENARIRLMDYDEYRIEEKAKFIIFSGNCVFYV